MEASLEKGEGPRAANFCQALLSHIVLWVPLGPLGPNSLPELTLLQGEV